MMSEEDSDEQVQLEVESRDAPCHGHARSDRSENEPIIHPGRLHDILSF